MALSTRLASAWLTSSRLPLTGAGASASTFSASPFSSASGSYSSPTSCAISAASNSFMSSRAWPDSARAIINSALKVRISPSDSSIVASSAARYSASLLAARSACSARLRSRVSGVLRSCAILSETSFSPCISASMRSSIWLRFAGEPVDLVAGAGDRQRSPRSPAMMRARCFGHGVDAAQHAARHEQAAGQAQHHARWRPTSGRRTSTM